MEYATVTIKSQNEDGSGVEFETRTMLGKKEYKLIWNDKNDFTLDVPTVLEYKDDFGKVVIKDENYAQHLLNGYKHLKLVKVVKKPLVTPATIKVSPQQIAKVDIVAEEAPPVVETPRVPKKKETEKS